MVSEPESIDRLEECPADWSKAKMEIEELKELQLEGKDRTGGMPPTWPEATSAAEQLSQVSVIVVERSSAPDRLCQLLVSHTIQGNLAENSSGEDVRPNSRRDSFIRSRKLQGRLHQTPRNKKQSGWFDCDHSSIAGKTSPGGLPAVLRAIYAFSFYLESILSILQVRAQGVPCTLIRGQRSPAT